MLDTADSSLLPNRPVREAGRTSVKIHFRKGKSTAQSEEKVMRDPQGQRRRRCSVGEQVPPSEGLRPGMGPCWSRHSPGGTAACGGPVLERRKKSMKRKEQRRQMCPEPNPLHHSWPHGRD